jgi:hypothetical protein
MAKYPLGGRPSKAALAKIKTGTIIVSVATFLGSLGGIALFNPGFSSSAAAANQVQTASSTQVIASTSQSSRSSAAQSSSQQQGITFPRVRTRGS